MSSNILNVGVSGLNASKRGMETTAHNIANARTPGFSRQRILQEASQPIALAGRAIGDGTLIKRIERVSDQMLNTRVNNNFSTEEFFKEQLNQLNQIEAIFTRLGEEGLEKIFSIFFNSFRDLSAQPDNEALRSVIRDRAQLVVKDFHIITSALHQISSAIDQRIVKNIGDINFLAKSIADLNVKIVTGEDNFNKANDLRDKRDNFIEELAKMVKISTFEDNRGRLAIQVDNLGALVVGNEWQELSYAYFDKEDSSNGLPNAVEILFKGAPNLKITDKFKEGSLGALIDIRNNQVRKMIDQMDQLAATLITHVNRVHRQGFVNRKIDMVDGMPVLLDRYGATTGIDFFKPVMEEAASRIELSDDIKRDLTNLVSSDRPNEHSNNKITLQIAALDGELLIDGKRRLEEGYLQMISSLASEIAKVNISSDQSEAIRFQTQSIKEQVSGVSIDEESTNIMRYQQAYDASAKILKTAGEMMDTVLKLG